MGIAGLVLHFAEGNKGNTMVLVTFFLFLHVEMYLNTIVLQAFSCICIGGHCCVELRFQAGECETTLFGYAFFGPILGGILVFVFARRRFLVLVGLAFPGGRHQKGRLRDDFFFFAFPGGRKAKGQARDDLRTRLY